MHYFKKNKQRTVISVIISLIFLLAIAGGAWGYLHRNVVIDVALSPEERAELLDRSKQLLNDIKNDPGNLDNYLELGIVEKTLGNLSKAAKAYRDGIKQNENFYLFYLNLGSVYEDMGKYDDAERMFREGILRKPLEEMGYHKLINLFLAHFQGRFDELDLLYKKAIEVTSDIDIMKSYARFLEDRGQTRDAWIYWQEVADRSPDPTLAKQEVERLRKELEGAE